MICTFRNVGPERTAAVERIAEPNRELLNKQVGQDGMAGAALIIHISLKID
jgi:hypothetical protein